MKIAFIMESWGNGGTETYVENLILGLKSKNIDYYLITLKPVEKNIKSPDNIKIEFCETKYIAKRLKNIEPDIIHLHLYTNLLHICIISKIYTSSKIIATLHIQMSRWNFIHTLYWKTSFKLCDTVIGVSRAIISEINNSKVLQKPIPGPFSENFISPKETHNESKEYKIVGSGRLEAQKDWPTLIRASAFVKNLQTDKEFSVHIYGAGSLRTELASLINNLNVPVELHGQVSQNILAEAIINSDLFVLPSIFEGLPLSAIESMALGAPTITSDFPAADELIENGKTGHIFPRGDDKTLSELIIWHMMNLERSKEIGRAGQLLVQRVFSREKFISQHIDIYKNILE